MLVSCGATTRVAFSAPRSHLRFPVAFPAAYCTKSASNTRNVGHLNRRITLSDGVFCSPSSFHKVHDVLLRDPRAPQSRQSLDAKVHPTQFPSGNLHPRWIRCRFSLLLSRFTPGNCLVNIFPVQKVPLRVFWEQQLNEAVALLFPQSTGAWLFRTECVGSCSPLQIHG